MKQEEKELLLKDLCARLPYGVKLRYVEDLVVKKESHTITLNNIYLEHIINGDADIKPYLRPISSMTQEEIDEYDAELDKDMDIVLDGALDKDRHITSDGKQNFSKNFVAYLGNDWLDKNMFDYRGLIPKGIALEAPEGMYKID